MHSMADGVGAEVAPWTQRLLTPAITLKLESGDSAVIALQGAQVLSWRTADGRERLYLSPKAVFDGTVAIRGGVPVCWPQFNRRGPLAKHGFARVLPWRVIEQQHGPHQARAVLQLTDAHVPPSHIHDAGWKPLWPHAYVVQMHVQLLPGELQMTLHIVNTGAGAMPFTAALHTYLAVDDIAQLSIDGADAATYWDAVAGACPSHPRQKGAIRFDGEVDRVYPRLAAATLREGTHGLCVGQSASMRQTIVWNPGATLCAQLVDLPRDGYRHFVCVEAGQIDEPVVLQPGQQWQGGQHLRAV